MLEMAVSIWDHQTPVWQSRDGLEPSASRMRLYLGVYGT